jgi:hypothetical protein
MNHEKGYKERNKGSIAEPKCVEFLESKKIEYRRLGFDSINNPIPVKDFMNMPKIIRSMPDFVVFQSKSIFLEVKGCNDILHLKVDDLEVYDYWNKIMPLSFFIYSKSQNKHKLCSLTEMKALTTIAPKARFDNDNKEHYKIEFSIIS